MDRQIWAHRSPNLGPSIAKSGPSTIATRSAARFLPKTAISKPDRPGEKKKPQVRGCQTLVPCGTCRQGSPEPGDGLGTHFDPTRLKLGPQGRFDVFGQKKKEKHLVYIPPSHFKTFEELHGQSMDDRTSFHIP